MRVAGEFGRSGNVDHDGRAEDVLYVVYVRYGNRDMCVCALQEFSAPDGRRGGLT